MKPRAPRPRREGEGEGEGECGSLPSTLHALRLLPQTPSAAETAETLAVSRDGAS